MTNERQTRANLARGHLVQVIGVPRSGTTMLERMIANGEECVQCGELADVFRLKLEWPSQLGHSRPCEKDVHHQLSRSTISGIVTDSSKERCWVVKSHRRALSHGMKVSNILVWKRPVELAYSRWKRGEIGRNRSHWMSEWLRVHQFYIRAGLPFATVRCSDLQTNPAGTLAKICNWLEIDYFSGKELFWKSNHEQIGGSPTALSTDDSIGIYPNTKLPDAFEAIRRQAIEFEASREVTAITQSLTERTIPKHYAQTTVNWSHSALVTVFDPIKRFYERRKLLSRR